MKFFFSIYVCFFCISIMAMEYDQILPSTTTKTLFAYTVPEYREEMLMALRNVVYEFDARKSVDFQGIERLVLQQAKLSYPEVYKACQERRVLQQKSHSEFDESSY